MIIHTVRDNETIKKIAAEYSISPGFLASVNGLSEGARVYCGEELAVVIPTKTATVRRGESLSSVAMRCGVKESELISLNPELCGTDRVYYGENLAVRKDPALFGTAALNGYLYKGCRLDRLAALMPYLCFVTVCAFEFDGKELRPIFDPKTALEMTKLGGRGALLRIYMEKNPKEGELSAFTDALAHEVKRGGYIGAVLSLHDGKNSGEVELKCKARLLEDDKILLVEVDSENLRGRGAYADGCVVYCDKINKPTPPSFEEYERGGVKRLSDEIESSGIFLDIPAFASYGDKHITEDEARGVMLRRCGEVKTDKNSGICYSEKAGRQGLPLRLESLENTLRRCSLVCEYALAGLSVDIGRISQKRLTVISSALNLCTEPMMTSITNI